MESRKQLEKVSSSTTSSTPLQQNLLVHKSPVFTSVGSSPLTIYGFPLQMTAEVYSNLCNSPALGLYTSGSGLSDCGGLTSLGLSTLPAHADVGTFQEWFHPTEAQIRGSAAFYPPLLGLNPMFVSSSKSFHPDLLSHASDVNGNMKRRGSSPPAVNSALNIASFPTNEKKENLKINPSRRQKNFHESMSSHWKVSKTNEKKLIKRQSESLNGCLLGSLSESSSDDDETSNNPDDEDLSSNDSGKGSPVKRKLRRLTHTSERPRAAPESLCHSVSVTSSFQPLCCSHPPELHQSTARFLPCVEATENNKQHISVTQPTRLAQNYKSVAQFHRQACPLSYRTLHDPDPKEYIPNLNSLKHVTNFTCQNQSSARCSPNRFKTKSPKSKTLTSLSKNTHTDGSRGRSSVDLNNFKLKKESVKRASSERSTNQSDKNMFVNFCLNGVTQHAVQDAPLALVTKPHSQSSSLSRKPLLASTIHSFTMPINLSTGSRETSSSSTSLSKSSNESELVSGSKNSTEMLQKGGSRRKPGPSRLPIDSTSSLESEFHSSKALEDSDDDDDDDDSEDGDSGNSLSDSESNLESDGSEDHFRETHRTLKLTATSGSTLESPQNLTPNQQVTDSLLLLSKNLPDLISNTEPLNKDDDPSSSGTSVTTPGWERRRKVPDERLLQLPLKFGWQRETRIRTVAGRLQGEVVYFAPCGKRLGQYPHVIKYLIRNGINEISRENFSFSTKVKVGTFYEGREGPEGLRWFQLAEEEVALSIKTMSGRHKKSDSTGVKSPPPVNVGENNLQEVTDAKLLRKLKAQEIARQAAQIKKMRKLEKQAKAQAAKEAKKQQARIAAEERRKKRDEMKIFKQQEKIKRIQRIRMEKELRAQQVLEEKRRKKEAAANAKLLEAEKRRKEKEIRRFQSILLKQQELEIHRLEMERERQRQHMIILKAVEAQKKAEKKERLRQEMKEKKRLNKEKKLELRRLELEQAKELKKLNEDMCLTDQKPLPELSRIPGLILEGKTFSNCLMVLEFLHTFGKVLRLDSNSDMLTFSNLQCGLLNIGDGFHMVQDLLVSMLSLAVCDPSIPAGCKCKTILGDHLVDVEINRDNVSDILQLYMQSHTEETELASLAVSLKTKAFQAHSPSQKAAILAFLVNELCCSKAVISEIDNKIDHMTNLRKDKWIVDGKLRELRNIYTKTTEKRERSVGGKDDTSTLKKECEKKEGDSEEEDGDNEHNDVEEGESGSKKKEAEICKEDKDSLSGSINDLEKQIEKMCTLQSQIREKLFDSSLSLRSMMIGEDRYKRRYWVLPQCGGIFIEGSEEAEKEEQRLMAAQLIRDKDELQVQETNKPEVSIHTQSSDCEEIKPESPQNKHNLFLQNPSSISKISKLFKGAKMTQNSDISPQNTPAEVLTSHLSSTSQMDNIESSELCATQLKNSSWMTHSPQSIIHYDQLSKILTEKSSEWFSLLPRSPCDGSSVTSSSSSSASSSSPQPIRTKASSFFFPDPSATATQNNTAGINNIQLPVSQQVNSGIYQSSLMLFSSATSSSLPLSDSSLPSQQAEANGNRDFCLTDSGSVNKSETTDPVSNKLPVELAKTQDHPHPLPIPEDMLRGWWRVSDMDELKNLVKTLHNRGIRERVLQNQIQKHMEHMIQLFPKTEDGFNSTLLEMQDMSRERVLGWCVEERAMEVDVNLLQHVEALEKKIICANLQVQGWVPNEPQSDSENLVYYEHKHVASSVLENQDEHCVSLIRRPNNPLDIAVTRLKELERNIERSSEEEEDAAGMKLWCKALDQVCSSAQLSLCIQQLHKSIAWERAVVKEECVQSPHIRKHPSQSAVWKRCSEGRPNSKPSVMGGCISEDDANSNAALKRGSKELKKRKGDDGIVCCPKKVKTSTEGSSELAVCQAMLAELEAHGDAWPFLTPVNHKAVPGYRKIIKKPMDFSTIKEKLNNHLYLNLETFTMDVNLVFDNCEKFNKDDSDVGRAGHSMRRFFDQRWSEFLQ